VRAWELGAQARESGLSQGLSQGPCQGVQEQIQDQRGQVVGKAWGEVILVDSTFREEHKSYTGDRLLCEGVLDPPPPNNTPTQRKAARSLAGPSATQRPSRCLSGDTIPIDSLPEPL